MTRRRTLISALAITGALAAGGAVGVALGVPTLSGAATSHAAATAAVGHKGGPGQQLDAAAKALGMSTDDLRAELDAGKTIAQVASEKSVDVNKVIDAMVAAAQTNLRQDITDFVNNGHPKGGPGHGRPGDLGPPGSRFNRGHAHGPGPELDAAAQALSLSAADLRTELQGGKSIAQVASDKGVDVNTVIDAMVNAATARIDQAVTDGKLTQADADTEKSALRQHITDEVNRTGKAHPPR